MNPIHPLTEELINWFSKAKRELPWRQTSDPYKIWLSEIILQQTRVEQGLPYYLNFVEQYPDVHALATASEDHVMRTWQGLGYYSRARNLHATAKYISTELGGVFPRTHDEIQKLKGVGPYTAAAIASIAFGESVPVIDGNVFRFISRHYGVYDDILKNGSRKVFSVILEDLIDPQNAGEFNQAMMEYGATICKPSPHCEECLFTQSCFAFKHKKQSELPVKVKKLKIKTRFFHYFVLINENKVLMRRREENIWQGLYEYLLIESSDENRPAIALNAKELEDLDELYSTKHLLTHQILKIRFYVLDQISDSRQREIMKEYDLEAIDRKEVLNLPKPKPIVNFLQETKL